MTSDPEWFLAGRPVVAQAADGLSAGTGPSWRALAETVPAAIVWTARPDGWVTAATDWNAATGLPETSVLGQGWLDALHPEDRPRAETAWAATAAGSGALPYDLKLRFRAPDGSWRWRHVRGTPVRDPATGVVREWVGLAQDIDARRRAETQAAMGEAAWRALVEATPGLVFVTDTAGSNVFTNRRYQDYAGRPAEALLGDGWLATLYPDDRARAVAAWAASVRTGEPYETEYRFLRANGEARWHLVRAVPQHDPATGQIERWVGTCTDLDDHRQAEVALRTAAERAQLALDAGAIIGTWVWDLPADAFTVDERFAFHFGIDPALGRSGLSLEQVVASVHPEDLPRLRAAIAEAIARGGPYACQYRVRSRDGAYHWIEANGRVDHAPDGTPLRFPGVLLDIEARRTAETERDRAIAMLHSFVEAVPGVVYAKDQDGRMLLANQGTAALIGKPTEAFLGRTDAEFLADPVQAAAVMATDRRIMAAGVAEQVEETVSLPDGTPAVWLSIKAPFRDTAGRVVGLIGTSIDITARKRAEAALHEALEVKEALLAEVNHRVKNSLQLVSSLLSLQASRAQAEETQAALNEARGRIGVVARLHQRLYRSGLYNAVDLVALLRELCTDTVAVLAGSGRIEVIFSSAEDVSELVVPIDRAVPAAMIVAELLTNALKYAYPEGGPGGQVRVSLCLMAAAAPSPETLVISVEDDGIGLAQDFDPGKARGIGMRVMTTLARQLRATFSRRPGARGRGTAFELQMSRFQVE